MGIDICTANGYKLQIEKENFAHFLICTVIYAEAKYIIRYTERQCVCEREREKERERENEIER